mgnify:CR=1 FL=1
MFRFHIPKTHLSFSTLYSRYKPLILLFFFSFCFFAGGLIARIFPASETTLTPASRTFISSSHSFVLPTTENWGLSFQEEGKAPVGNASFDELKKYNAYYARNTDQKVIYLTFDCGYENGNTPSILAALKKHHVPATFFVVGNFLQDNPDLIKQMQKEGHTVGNHTYHHPDMSQIATQETFSKELSDVEDLFKKITGKSMTRFYRPPQGKYSVENLKQAQQLGYTTVFWSLAYVDWNTDDQPSAEEAYAKLLPRIHDGAIVLLHSTSVTNAAILDDLLTKWEEMGYTFASLDQLPGLA